ncbi:MULTISPECIES: DUF805 domain-containing protein [unclassified Leptolyngbya]|uniref:DUF805 domain-containing protein n=1 Tax=unclassified Leptolyngbya TaxID=2650499 RepID=UPI00168A27E3|nr:MULTISPECIES: DUF805 domain-containing protein [unclassified Leptolyngbya]MBD1913836.1 DUF805 domain-containing protein [Leptolyngbya sp. FACHB-8]MBD2157346.1 DUF805 domain-containing protein [Leptolyngbya sp. FACHB-16]
MEWYLTALQKYAVISGRARRREYWYFVLFNFLISLGLGIIDGVLGLTIEGGLGVLGGLYSLAVFIPGTAVTVRRLHDTGRSGWWLLLVLVPLIGPLVVLFFLVGDSQPGTNQYG